MRREKISEFCGSGDPLVISSKTTLTIAEKRIAGKISPDTSDDRLQKGIDEVKEVEIGELHPYEVCKAEIKSAARGCDTMGAWNLCAKFETLERIVKSLGSNGVMYRSLFCMHIFANVAEAAFFNELLLAKAGLCEGEVDDEILRQIASIISGIRSIVGWKAFQEAVVTNWQKALSSERFRSDPPLYYASMRSGEDRANSRDAAEEFYRSLEKSLCITIRRPCASDFKVSWNYSRRICWKKAKMEKLEVQKKNSHNVAVVDSNSTAINASADEPCSSQSGKKNSVFELLRSIEGLYEDSESIERHVVELLTSARTDDALQGELIDLLGIEQFDLVGALLECRASLLAEADAMKDESKKHSKIAQMMTLKLAKNSPQYCQQVVVQSKMEADLRREARREQKRANKQLNRITHAFGEAEKLELELAQRDIMRQRQLELIAAQSTPSTEGNRISVVHRERYPFVFDATLANDETTLIINGTKLCVPVGTKRIDHRTYEEVTVPPSDITSIQDVRHIYIKDMDELGQLAFKGYEKLNVIQSIVFEQAYKTRENLLICAPTGAGKTNIALLAILNVVHGYIHKGVVQKDDFKIIYIAPMKALATEMTENFGKRLEAIGLKVRELTGDTTLSKREIAETQMLVLTPEKWDVVTRKDSETSLTRLMRLLIIDEVHLLHDDRGPVIETIVARTLRQVEMSQQGVRIVGLSATLPNYVDVAKFLRVNLYKGLFFFDSRFRPVPLSQTFIGVRKAAGSSAKFASTEMDEVCYEKVHEFARQGHQVLVFVHTRNATAKLATFFRERAAKFGHSEDFRPPNVTTKEYMAAKKAIMSSHNGQLIELFQFGYSIHHAGLPRRNRLAIEKFFASGHIKVLFCTATLAWGINLPAHAVVIRGTEVFNAQKGTFTDIGVLDVQQIFGRAGRPQYENSGHGIIITWQRSLIKYVAMLTRQIPIESQLMAHIYDNLNAEIVLGTVSDINEAVEWLSYSYYFIRAKLNPLNYGIPHSQIERDPELREYLTKAVTEAAEKLDRNQMIRFDSLNGYVAATDLGRVASHYYVKYETIEMLNEGIGDVKLTQLMTDDNVLKLIANASEFSQIKVCEGEIEDLEDLLPFCPLRIKQGGLATPSGKINCLLQAYMSRVDIRNFSLLSESLYIYENAGRLCRAIFEIVLRRGWAQATNAFLVMAKCIEKRIWPFQTPLRQIEDLRFDIYDKIERRRLSYNQLFEMPPKELGSLLSCDGQRIYEAIRMLPSMYVDASIKPITNTIIQISLTLLPAFIWNDQLLGARGTQSFWVFVEDINENFIIHFENFFINKRKVQFNEECNMILTIPIRDQQLTHNYQVRVASNYYVVDDSTIAISMHNCVLPSAHRPHTDLLDLDPLPITALKNKIYESVYDFAYFNPIQTQVFYCLYNTDQNALIGAPTGSGKTLCAELAMYRVFTRQPTKKCVYIAPLKALVRERVNDWSETLGRLMRFRTVELTGDHTPDVRSLAAARLVITTPEKWDGITRGWETREYVKDVALVVIDEIHLLGVERGAVLEAIITRLKLMASKQCSDSTPVRIVGLSTALANAGDVAEWLNVKDSGLFNFRPNVRPIPIEVHIAGFPGQQYCPRMALMNRPAFKAIKSYSPHKPVLVFVASRRQTRLTAMAFVSQLVSEDDPRQWLHMDVQELEYLTQTIKDESLKLTLPFGIGMHHAGLQQHERSLVEQLFVDRKIQVLIATATLAWGINMPAHLVIVKGTEYYDGKTHKYVNFPVTDVLQMMGRAGRPQYDDSAVAVIYVQDVKKNFYKRFLYEPFPVESSMLPVLANHVNAEVHAGTITSKHQIMEYIAGTYLYRRLFANPSYYEVVEATSEALTAFLVDVVDTCVDELLQSRCITVDEEDQTISSAPLGRIASVYYLQHETVRFFAATISEHSSVEDLLRALADNPEYGEIPVRHNEDQINAQLQRYLPIKLPTECAMDSSHTKAHLLLQAHLSRTTIPTDYVTDQRSVLDQCVRILQAMFDVSLLSGWLSASLNVVTLLQMIMQARWHTDHPLLVLPHMTEEIIERIAQDATIPLLQNEFGVDGKQNIEVAKKRAVAKILDVTTLDERQANEILSALLQWPIMYPKRCSLTRKEEEIRIELVQDEGRPVFIRVEAGAVYKLRFFVEMIGPNRYQSDAFCPRFPKEKSAGWILLVGEKDSGQLIAYAKTPPVIGSRELRVEVKMPMKRGRQILAVFILSDSYLGIDQEYNLHCDVI